VTENIPFPCAWLDFRGVGSVATCALCEASSRTIFRLFADDPLYSTAAARFLTWGESAAAPGEEEGMGLKSRVVWRFLALERAMMEGCEGL